MNNKVKVKLPSTIEIGCHQYSLLLDKSLKAQGEYAKHYSELTQIRLAPGEVYSQTLVSFLHETLHSIDNHYLDTKLKDETVSILAEGLAQVLGSIGIELDFSELKHINIEGTDNKERGVQQCRLQEK